MFKYIIRFSNYVWNSWKTEFLNFISSRKEIIYLREFRIAFIISILAWILLPLWVYIWESFNWWFSELIFLIFVLVWDIAALAWLAWVWFITIWSIIFDNIPTVWDILWIVDMSKWIWLEKSTRISKWLSFKENIQEKVWKFLTKIIIKLTINTSSYWVHKIMLSFNKLKRLKIYEFISWFLFALFIMYIPVTIITFIWFVWLIWYTRPTIWRLPIIILALIYLLFVSFFPIGIFLFFLMWWYTFFFSEKEDLLKLRPIIQAILYKDERIYN